MRQTINDGVENEMAATLVDVAKRAGVSTASASLVLSGRSEGRVSASKAESIREAARELNYVRNGVAGSLRTKTSTTVGLVTDYIASTPYAFEMVAAATAAARAQGYMLFLTNTDGDQNAEAEALDEFRSQHVDHVAFAPMWHREITLPDNVGDNLVIINGFEASGTVPSVVPDEFTGEYDAVRHLIDLGHTRIAHISDDGSSIAGWRRIDGYHAALKESGIDINPDYLVRASFTENTVDAAVATLLDCPIPPTAITCFNDGMAAGVYREAARRGLSIPDDLSVVGFDNFRVISTNLDPGLTTVQLPHVEMATWGIQTLLALCEDAPAGGGAHPAAGEEWPLKLPCPMVIRASTAPPSSKDTAGE